jgi:hypothetical protein
VRFSKNIVIAAKIPLFGKEGKGEILWRIDVKKIPLHPPFPKGE